MELPARSCVPVWQLIDSDWLVTWQVPSTQFPAICQSNHPKDVTGFCPTLFSLPSAVLCKTRYSSPREFRKHCRGEKKHLPYTLPSASHCRSRIHWKWRHSKGNSSGYLENLRSFYCTGIGEQQLHFFNSIIRQQCNNQLYQNPYKLVVASSGKPWFTFF